jgi:predicted DNA-binding transcriptional regulator AlpA
LRPFQPCLPLPRRAPFVDVKQATARQAAMDDQVNGQQAGGASADLMQGWLGRREVAEALGISAATLQRWQSQRVGPPLVRIGRRVFYRADAFREWMISRERGPVVSKRSGAGR